MFANMMSGNGGAKVFRNSNGAQTFTFTSFGGQNPTGPRYRNVHHNQTERKPTHDRA